MCTAARLCAEHRTDLRPQATGRGLLYTPGTSLQAAAEEALLPLSGLDCRDLNESALSRNGQHGGPPLTQLFQALSTLSHRCCSIFSAPLCHIRCLLVPHTACVCVCVTSVLYNNRCPFKLVTVTLLFFPPSSSLVAETCIFDQGKDAKSCDSAKEQPLGTIRV